MHLAAAFPGSDARVGLTSAHRDARGVWKSTKAGRHDETPRHALLERERARAAGRHGNGVTLQWDSKAQREPEGHAVRFRIRRIEISILEGNRKVASARQVCAWGQARLHEIPEGSCLAVVRLRHVSSTRPVSTTCCAVRALGVPAADMRRPLTKACEASVLDGVTFTEPRHGVTRELPDATES